MEGLNRRERTDVNVVPVRVSERELHSPGARVDMGLLFQPDAETSRPCPSSVEVIDTEKQEEAVARLGVLGACQRRMLVVAPSVQAEQDRSIRVDDLPKVVMGRSRFRQTKQQLVPL